MKKADIKYTNLIPDWRAFRLMEALSGVDEALIERSEQSAVRAQPEIMVGFTLFRKNVMKYSKSWAAVLCVAVVGALAWGGYAFVDNFRMGSVEMANHSTNGIRFEKDAGCDTTINALGATYQGANAEVEQPMEKEDSGRTDILIDDSRSESVNLNESVKQKESASQLTSLAEVCSIAVLGECVPTKVPSGYSFESASYTEGAPGKLSVCWTRGMDSIFWNVQVVEDEQTLYIVDVSKEEMYNEHLYEIPLANTLPEEYREIFMDPVCKWENFNLEFVEKRMISRGVDMGDTQTPRGIFSVLYPDNCLVKFNGRGTAEEIYDMFVNLNHTIR